MLRQQISIKTEQCIRNKKKRARHAYFIIYKRAQIIGQAFLQLFRTLLSRFFPFVYMCIKNTISDHTFVVQYCTLLSHIESSVNQEKYFLTEDDYSRLEDRFQRILTEFRFENIVYVCMKSLENHRGYPEQSVQWFLSCVCHTANELVPFLKLICMDFLYWHTMGIVVYISKIT